MDRLGLRGSRDERERGMKLTQPQIATLVHFAEDGPCPCSTSYAPTRKLRDLGLIRVFAGKWGGERAEITDAGSEWLKENGMKGKDE